MLHKYSTKFLSREIITPTHTAIKVHRQIIQRNLTNDMDNKKRPEHLQLTATQKREPGLYDAKITRIEQLSPTIKGFTLQVTSKTEKNLSFKAGQWVDFFIPGLDKVGGYSMCSDPAIFEKYGELDLAVKNSTWAPAEWLHTQAKVGSNVAFKVGGEFHYPNKIIEATYRYECEHDILLIAGGVGINPLASIFFHLHQLEVDKRSSNHDNGHNVHLLYSSQTKEELIFCDKIREIVASNKLAPNTNRRKCTFKATFFATQDTDTIPDMQNRRINVNDIKDVIQEFSEEKNDVDKRNRPLFCFLYGPPDMIKDMARLLIDLGIPKERVMYEMWW